MYNIKWYSDQCGVISDGILVSVSLVEGVINSKTNNIDLVYRDGLNMGVIHCTEFHIIYPTIDKKYHA